MNTQNTIAKQKITFEELESETSKILPNREELVVMDYSMATPMYGAQYYGAGGYTPNYPSYPTYPNTQFGNFGNQQPWSGYPDTDPIHVRTHNDIWNTNQYYYNTQYPTKFHPDFHPNFDKIDVDVDDHPWKHLGHNKWDNPHYTPARYEPSGVQTIRIDPIRVEPIHIDPIKIEPIHGTNPMRFEPITVNVDPIKVEPITIQPGNYVTPGHYPAQYPAYPTYNTYNPYPDYPGPRYV